jgi:hypothetical protein
MTGRDMHIEKQRAEKQSTVELFRLKDRSAYQWFFVHVVFLF